MRDSPRSADLPGSGRQLSTVDADSAPTVESIVVVV